MRATRQAGLQRKSQISPVRFRVVAAVALMAAVAVFAATTDIPDASARTRLPIMVAAEADRSPATNLDGAARAGLAYVFVTAGSPVDKVTFVLDQGTATARTLTDDTPPYDLMGTAPDGTAKPLDLSKLSVGAHKVVARFFDAAGRSVARSSANFTVMAPKPTTTPSPAPTTPAPSTTPTTPAPSTTPTTSSPTPSSPTTSAPTVSNEVIVNAAPGGIAAAIAQVNEINKQGKAVRLALQPTIYRESLVLEPGSR